MATLPDDAFSAEATPHVEYEKMFETTARWVVPRNLQTSSRRWKPPADQWAVSEKVHGACFALVVDSATAASGVVRAAKRSAFLAEESGYFEGFRAVVAAHTERTLSLHESLRAEMTAAEEEGELIRTTVYGELFGGGYAPEELLSREQRSKMVQTEIVYCNDLGFYAFDIAVHVRRISSEVVREYLSYERAVKLFAKCGFFHAEPLFVGTFEQALAHSVDFETTIPRRLGLPSLGSWNRAEGVVIKPWRAVVYVGVADGKPGRVFRAIVKHKAAQFLEKVSGGGASRVSAASGDAAASVLSWLEQYVNKNRVASVMSKHGPRQSQHAKRSAQLVVADALTSAKDDDASMWARHEALKPAQRQAIQASLERLAATLL